MSALLSANWILAAALWYFVNGVLHDFFVIKNHKTGYDRDLLRLLMDGHVLITCGVFYLLAYNLLANNNATGIYLCIASSLSLLVYCGLIFPFLKSMVTIFINTAVLIFVVTKMFT